MVKAFPNDTPTFEDASFKGQTSSEEITRKKTKGNYTLKTVYLLTLTRIALVSLGGVFLDIVMYISRFETIPFVLV